VANRFMKFYPSDWRSEKRLKLISRAARSLWIDMLGLMFDEGTGRLEVDGRPMTVKELADILGDNPRTTKKLLAEIEEKGVSSRDKDGFVISRRIVQDFKKAEQDKLNGRKGGNPALKTRENGEKGVNPKDKTQKPEARSQSKKEAPNGASKNIRGTRLVEDWVLPRDWGEWAVGEGWSVQQIRTESDKFKDYWIAQPGARGVKLDWQATWRNWMRNSKATKGSRHDQRFGDQVHGLAKGLSEGSVQLDTRSRDPFAS
jgi:hypothetical protein